MFTTGFILLINKNKHYKSPIRNSIIRKILKESVVN